MAIIGTRLVAKNLRRYGGGFLNHVNKTMEGISKLLYKEVTKNISSKDNSLGDLADMDHPYARRHGERGKPIHTPYWIVHTKPMNTSNPPLQSGDLLSSASRGIVKASISGGKLSASAWVELDENMAPHAPHVIFGTSNMIPRPVLEESKNNVIPEAFKKVEKNLKYLTINFKPMTK